jgi:cyclophilin family peptidyl-prolyl cis-trans isomerase
MKHFHSDSETAVEYREAWELAAANGEKVFSEIETHAYKLFIQPGKPEPAVARVADILSRKYYEEGKIEKCYQVAKKFHELIPQDEAAKTDLARIAILCNDFESAEENLIPNKVEGYSEIERILFMQIPKLKENFAYEMKMREKDAAAEEPLPQVKLEIKNHGDVIIELYEDQAPETVGNFINLVESGFYDGMAFFRVMSHLVCESGEATLEGKRSAGYEIHPEHERKHRRFHLRGSVGMRSEGENVNSGSVFFIAKIPMPGLDSQHTSFGRVVSGMNHIDDLTVTIKSVQDEETKEHRDEFIHESVPDVITRATVVRKRKHGKYEPNRIE